MLKKNHRAHNGLLLYVVVGTQPCWWSMSHIQFSFNMFAAGPCVFASGLVIYVVVEIEEGKKSVYCVHHKNTTVGDL